jgi:hypothetical protein
MASGQPLRGFAGQGMNGHKRGADAKVDAVQVVEVTSLGTGSVTVLRHGWALIYLLGVGGSGEASAGRGGGGGAALYRRVRVTPGQIISWTLGTPGAAAPTSTPGNDGTDSTVTTPTGLVLKAGAGKGGTSVAPGAGGVATGGDINRNGGAGGTFAGNGVGAGLGGGNGGAGSGNGGGGGGGAGFSDVGSALAGGSGGAGPSGAGALYGGGGGGTVSGTGFDSGAGVGGRLVIWFVRPF